MEVEDEAVVAVDAALTMSQEVIVAVELFAEADSKCFSSIDRGMTAFAAAPATEMEPGDLGDGAVCVRFFAAAVACTAACAATICAVDVDCRGWCGCCCGVV